MNFDCTIFLLIPIECSFDSIRFTNIDSMEIMYTNPTADKWFLVCETNGETFDLKSDGINNQWSRINQEIETHTDDSTF